MYPIKNLEDLYDKEGCRDGEFKKGDKGTWTISTDFAKSNKQGEMNSEGMVLHFNRNTRTARGYYTVRTTYDEVDKLAREKNTVLNLKTIRQFYWTKQKMKILNKKQKISKFFGQYADFKDLKNYKNGRISSNLNVPYYEAEYKRNNSDGNGKKLREKYPITTKQSPILKLHIDGDIKGSSVRYKQIEYTFSKEKDDETFMSDFLNFGPSHSKQ